VTRAYQLLDTQVVVTRASQHLDTQACRYPCFSAFKHAGCRLLCEGQLYQRVA
jgi:hypothetical protein